MRRLGHRLSHAAPKCKEGTRSSVNRRRFTLRRPRPSLRARFPRDKDACRAHPAAPPTRCAPSCSSRASRQICRRLVPRPLRRHPCPVHGSASRTRCRPSCATAGAAGSRPNTACCRARPTRAPTARRRAASNRAAPRKFSASSAARCAPSTDLAALGERQIRDRLRRAPGRWRHAHRRHHRQLCGAVASALKTLVEAGLLAATAARRRGGGGVVRHHARACRCSISTMPRIPTAAGRRQFRPDRPRAASSRCRRPPKARSSPKANSPPLLALARSGIGGAASRCNSKALGLGVMAAPPCRRKARDRHAQSGQARRDRATCWRPTALRRRAPAALGLPEPEETGATFEANAALKARAAARASGLARAWPTIPGWSCRRLAARPAFIPRAGPGRSGISRGDARSSASSAARIARAYFVAVAGAGLARRSRRMLCAARSRGASSCRRAAPGASATTRSSCRQDRTETFGEMDPADKHRISHRAGRSGNSQPPASEAPGERRDRPLCPLAVLQVEMSLLRLQLPCPRRHRGGALARGAAARARSLWREERAAADSSRCFSAAARRR